MRPLRVGPGRIALSGFLFCLTSCGDRPLLGSYRVADQAERHAERLVSIGLDCEVVTRKLGSESRYALRLAEPTHLAEAQDLIARLSAAESSAIAALPGEVRDGTPFSLSRPGVRDREEALCRKIAAEHKDIVSVVVALPRPDAFEHPASAGFVGTPRSEQPGRKFADVNLHVFEVLGRSVGRARGENASQPTLDHARLAADLEARVRRIVSVICAGAQEQDISVHTTWISARWCGTLPETASSELPVSPAARTGLGHPRGAPLGALIGMGVCSVFSLATVSWLFVRLRRRRNESA